MTTMIGRVRVPTLLLLLEQATLTNIYRDGLMTLRETTHTRCCYIINVTELYVQKLFGSET